MRRELHREGARPSPAVLWRTAPRQREAWFASVAHCLLSRVGRHLPAQAVPPTDAATRLLGVLREATALSHISRRRRSKEAAPLVRSTDEPELYEVDARGESYYGRISTLAEIKSGRRKGRKSDQEYVKLVPYFGAFCGQERCVGD